MDLSIDLKMYRMKWVKSITDVAFANLREAILKKHSFNLDKGFSEENLQKIKKYHQKKGLTQKQSYFYLGLEQKTHFKPNQNRKNNSEGSSQSNSEDSQVEQSASKKVKVDPDLNSYYRSAPTATLPFRINQSYELDRNSYPFTQNQQIYDPRIGNQHFSQGAYFPQQSMSLTQKYPKEHPKIEENIMQSSYLYSGQNTQSSVNSYYSSTPATFPIQNFQKKSQNGHSFKREQTSIKASSNIQKVQLLRERLEKGLIKCRQCGLFFETHQVYEKHALEHFLLSLQRANEVQAKIKSKKQTKIKFFDIKSWEAVQELAEKQYKFQVPLSEIPEKRNEKINCYFCNQPLEVSFSSNCEDWVLSNSIKINDGGDMKVMHFECYQCFKSDQESPLQS